MTDRPGTSAEVLLTGASGFLGKVVLHELLRRRAELGIARVHVLLRDRPGSPAAARLREEVQGSPCFSHMPPGWEARIEGVSGDLEQPDAGLSPAHGEALAARISHIVHCAASVDFDLPLPRATAANVGTALHVLELARRCPRLEALVSVSTAYATPHPGDAVAVEERLAPLPRPAEALHRAILAGRYDTADATARLLAETGHPNTYTFTKCLAEHLLAERRAGLPLVVMRPSILSASWRHPFPGWIDSPAAFALFCMAVGSGRMHAVVARPRAHLDLVPVDVAAERVVDAAFDGVARSAARKPAPTPPPIRHVVAGLARSPSLRLCGERVGAYFERTPLDGAPAARVHYLGPDGARYRRLHRRHHERRAESAPIARRLDETNRRFAYFTHHTFRFQSSVPFRDAGFDPAAYLDLVCRGVYRHLLGGDERCVTLAGRDHRRDRTRTGWVLRQPHGNAFIRGAGWVVDATLRRAFDRVTIDVASFRQALEAAPPGSALVLAPSHRSYLDFVLLSYLCFARPDLGVAIPHIAAASDFARIPLLGRLFRSLHAFYLERGRGGEDKSLTRTVHRLVADGCVLEFFVEGQRSRSRRFRPPRRGLLRALQSTGRPCSVLPVAISYEHLPEEETFLEELRGAPKPPMLLRDLLGWTRRLTRGEISLGRAHVACGRPLQLDLETDVPRLAREILHELQGAIAITTHQLRSFCEAERIAGVDATWLAGAVARRGGRVLETPPLGRRVHPLAERSWRAHLEPHFHAEAALLFAGNPAAAHHLRTHRFGPVSATRASEASLADPRAAAVVRALFAPVCRAYAATGRALGPPAAPGTPLPSPAEVAGRIPDAWLPDVEDAFAALVECGILAGDATGRRFAWGPRARDVDGWCEACRSTGPVAEEHRPRGDAPVAEEHRTRGDAPVAEGA